MDALSRLAHGDDHRPPPDSLIADVPMEAGFDDFLDLFEDLRGLVPSSFFLLFKIARIIKSPNAKLAGQLKGFYDICLSADRRAQVDAKSKKTLSENVPVISGHDPHFGDRRIKGIEEIAFVKPGDVAQEEFTDLMRKAEEQQLQIRVLLRDGSGQAGMETAPIKEQGTRQMVNAAEQKLYILFDRSYSMWNDQRMLFAKVLAIEYLRQKKRSGARLFLRFFDYEVYDLIKISDPSDYDKLIRELLYVEPGGKGTDIGHAIEVAAKDIQFDGMFDGAEILLITDGMDAIDADRLKEALGEKTKLHMLKIGRDTAEPQQSELKDLIEKDRTVAGMSRDEVTQYYKHKLQTAWDQICETLLETDDLTEKDIDIGEPEINFALRAVDATAAVDPEKISPAEAETAFRKASFLEGFVELMIGRAEMPGVAQQHKAELVTALAKLNSFKLRVAAKSGVTAYLLAAKEVRFVVDRKLRKQAKKAKMSLEDLGRMQETTDLMLKLKTREPEGGGGGKKDGISLWKLLGMIAKSATKSLSSWLFSDEEEEEEEHREDADSKGTAEGEHRKDAKDAKDENGKDQG